MPSTKDNQKFTESLFSGSTLLNDALEWIRDNMKPNQVFGDNELGAWAEDNGYTKEVNAE
jgi:hypothetical protein